MLEKIKKENDIKQIPLAEMPLLAEEIRQFLIDKISKTGGHLASNLGVVELTMAMHLVFDLPGDKIVWDVGHQSYTHKLLTGRKEGFDGLRKYGGMSGFPKRSESSCDAFDTGHSSTALSAGMGFVKARDIKREDHYVISVLGDGSLTGGMAYEALNNAAGLKTNYIMVLNDNNMSISENVGGMSKYLNSIRTAEAYSDLKQGVMETLEQVPVIGQPMTRTLRKTKNTIKQLMVPGMFFEDMDITYLGPVDGHDIRGLIQVMGEAKRVRGPVLVHVLTKKGKGYEPAEKSPSKFHGPGPFSVETGESLSKSGKDSYTEVFSKVIYDLGRKDPELVAITAAMPDGTGLTRFKDHFKDRFFDVGIAEEHAVTFAAGLAAGGLKPVFAVYSSFLQRAYDQLIHDVCLQNLHVILAVDRAGLVGNDGETHQGVFDLSYLSSIPNMTVMSPKHKWELADMIRFAVDFDGPIAFRYPRGTAYDGYKEYRKPIVHGRSERIYEEEDIAILSVGHMFETAVKVRQALKEIGYNCTLVNSRFVKPIDEEVLEELAGDHKLFVTMEENVLAGGYGQKVEDCVQKRDLAVRVLTITLPDEYVEHGSIDVLRREVMLDEESIVKQIVAAYTGL